MTKSKYRSPDDPIYFHNAQPVLVKLGTIRGQQLFVELQGDVVKREQDYLLIINVLQEALNPSKDTQDLL